MAGVLVIDSPGSDSQKWENIDWNRINNVVNRIQIRIVKAVRMKGTPREELQQWFE